jgi:hypothetical protein
MKRLALLFGLTLAVPTVPACAVETAPDASEEVGADEDALALATDTKVKNAVVKASAGLAFMSESDHPLAWIRSAKVELAPASAALVHRAFSKVTDSDAMADRPLSAMTSETVAFESFASRFVPVAGEDADNLAYHTRMTKVMSALRANLKNPIVIRLGRVSGDNLVGAISVYIVGTLPSGKVGGLFTVSVET